MSYGFYASITTDNTKVSGSSDLTNFPMLVSGIYDGTGGEPDLRTTANGGNIQNTASGGASGSLTVPADLVFGPNTDGSAPYDFEHEYYVATTGQIISWVEIPTLDYDADFTYYMVYGDSGVSTSQEDVNGTWGAYDGVYHLNGSYDGTASEVKDSGGSDHGAGVASRVPTQTTGKVGYGQDFASDVISVGDVTTYDGATELVLECWVDFDSFANFGQLIRKVGSNAANRGFTVGSNGTTDELDAQHGDGSGYLQVDTTNANLATAGGWYLIAVEWTAASATMAYYINASTPSVNKVNAYSLSQINNSDAPLLFGARIFNSNYDLFLNGQMDEIRLSTTAKGADWHYTNYNSQNAPSTFYTMGSETAAASSTETASVSPLALSVALPSVTATHQIVVAASVAALELEASLPAVGATYLAVISAEVSPLGLQLGVPAVSRTYIQVETASVSPLAMTLSPVSVYGYGLVKDFPEKFIFVDGKLCLRLTGKHYTKI